MLLEDLMDLWKRCNFPVRDGLVLLSLRGTKVTNGKVVLTGERTNYFDDTMFMLDPAKNLIDHITCTAGQPGWYWINKYGAGEGAPITRHGCYAYVRGDHKGHEALRQKQDETGRLAVVRDVNKDGVPNFAVDADDYFDYPLTTGINIHACTGTPETVGVWSSGCHVIKSDWNGGDWNKLYHLTYGTYKTQPRFLYGVCEGAWLFDDAKRLMMGSWGTGVENLRKFLAGKGIPCSTSGSFDMELDKAYRKWQRMQKRQQNGICVNPEWL